MDGVGLYRNIRATDFTHTRTGEAPRIRYASPLVLLGLCRTELTPLPKALSRVQFPIWRRMRRDPRCRETLFSPYPVSRDDWLLEPPV